MSESSDLALFRCARCKRPHREHVQLRPVGKPEGEYVYICANSTFKPFLKAVDGTG